MTLVEPTVAGLFRGPAPYVAKTPWGPILALIAGLVIVIASAALMVGGVVLPRFTGFNLWPPDIGELAPLGLWQAATVILTVSASTLRGGRARDVLALGPPAGAPWVYLWALLLMAAMQIFVSVVQYSFLRHDMYTDLRPFVHMFAEHWLLAVLIVGIGAPLSEELLFRGFLLSALAGSRLGFWGGALLSTSLWTALHAGYSPAGIVEVFLIGLYLSWLVRRTGSLRVAMFCHGLYNSLVVLMLRYAPLPA